MEDSENKVMPPSEAPPNAKPIVSQVKDITKDVLVDIPFGTAVYNFFVQEGKAVKNGWLAFAVFSGLALWIGWGWGTSGEAELRANDDNLKRDNQLLSQKNGDLELTIAPLIARAAKEFPGEEINESLKKIVFELAARDPLSQPIATGSAAIDIIVRPPNGTVVPNAHYMEQGAFVVFGSGATPLLLANSHDSYSVPQLDGSGDVNAVCQSPSNSPYMGKPISSLLDAKYIQINTPRMVIPKDYQIVGGTVTWTINSSVTLKFNVPPQTVSEGFQNSSQIMIMELSDGLKPLSPTLDKSAFQP